MKRLISFILLFVTVLLCLCACSAKKDEKSSLIEPSASECTSGCSSEPVLSENDLLHLNFKFIKPVAGEDVKYYSRVHITLEEKMCEGSVQVDDLEWIGKFDDGKFIEGETYTINLEFNGCSVLKAYSNEEIVPKFEHKITEGFEVKSITNKAPNTWYVTFEAQCYSIDDIKDPDCDHTDTDVYDRLSFYNNDETEGFYYVACDCGYNRDFIDLPIED